MKLINRITVVFSLVVSYSLSQTPIEPPNRHEFVARVNGTNEVNLGNYVVVASFASQDNAKHFADELKKNGYEDISCGFLKNKNRWYVYFGDYSDVELAKKARDEYRKIKMFQDAYLLTVHKS